MSPEVLAVGEPLEAGEADEALRLVVVQLTLRQAQAGAARHAGAVLPRHRGKKLGRSERNLNDLRCFGSIVARHSTFSKITDIK